MLLLIIPLVVLLLASSSSAISLKDRSSLEFQLGIRGEGTIDEEYRYNGIVQREGMDNMAFSMGFRHWVERDVAVSISLLILAGESNHWVDGYGVCNEDYGVVSFQLGARYYFRRSNPDSPILPYLAFGAGPVIGGTDLVYADGRLGNESRTMTAYGAYLGGGVDLAFGRRILMGLNMGYYGMTDFARPVGNRKNYSDPIFNISFSFLFGGRH
jgi:hypothetical protein